MLGEGHGQRLHGGVVDVLGDFVAGVGGLLALSGEIHPADRVFLGQADLEVGEAVAAHAACEAHHGRLADMRLRRQISGADAGGAVDVRQDDFGDIALGPVHLRCFDPHAVDQAAHVAHRPSFRHSPWWRHISLAWNQANPWRARFHSFLPRARRFRPCSCRASSIPMGGRSGKGRGGGGL